MSEGEKMNEEWKSAYQTFDVWNGPKAQRGFSGFEGYWANMIDQSLRKDDPVGFVGWMREAKLDRNATTLDNLTMEQYCNKRNAPQCKAALSELESEKRDEEITA